MSPRKLLRPLELMGYTLPAGVGVSAAIGVAHFREETYPEPLRFRPERFLERKFSPFEYLPFGAGPRTCIGLHFALLEGPIVLATLLRRLRFAACGAPPGLAALSTLRPGPGFRMHANRRGPAAHA